MGARFQSSAEVTTPDSTEFLDLVTSDKYREQQAEHLLKISNSYEVHGAKTEKNTAHRSHPLRLSLCLKLPFLCWLSQSCSSLRLKDRPGLWPGLCVLRTKSQPDLCAARSCRSRHGFSRVLCSALRSLDRTPEDRSPTPCASNWRSRGLRTSLTKCEPLHAYTASLCHVVPPSCRRRKEKRGGGEGAGMGCAPIGTRRPPHRTPRRRVGRTGRAGSPPLTEIRDCSAPRRPWYRCSGARSRTSPASLRSTVSSTGSSPLSLGRAPSPTGTLSRWRGTWRCLLPPPPRPLHRAMWHSSPSCPVVEPSARLPPPPPPPTAAGSGGDRFAGASQAPQKRDQLICPLLPCPHLPPR